MSAVREYIEALLASPLAVRVTHHRITPGREAEYAATARPWPAAVQGVLQAGGIPALYTHQARAADLIRAGRDVITATPTASGKTLIYSLPVLERRLIDPEARTLMLFPLKALARDQLAAFQSLTVHWPEAARPTAALYDGDLSASCRKKIRDNPPDVLISNPEMLHLSLLPHHEQWTTFLASLCCVVVDEAHTYRGVLGSHMTQLFRRLGRICGRYGARPGYVFCTATVGNPAELAGQLLGRNAGEPPVPALTCSGAPAGPRHFVFMDPESSPATTAIKLLQAALARELRTIVYCRSRRMTELVALWAAEKAGPAAARISAYRAGFLPEERREIENRLASGELLAVISTSALELGIDIGSLDLCILVGYPGTVTATLQRGGRVGRAGQESAVVLVAGEDALDQYFIRNPEAFFERRAERVVVNPDNEVIVKRHLECAAAELPLRPAEEPWLQSTAAGQALAALEAEGLLLRTADGRELLAARKRPQRRVDLRGCGASFTIVDDQGNPIGSVDGHRARHETHPGALYLHRGRRYLIRDLDPATRTAQAEPVKGAVNWFTRTRSFKTTEILSVADTGTAFGADTALARLRVTETVTGYEKRTVGDNRLLSVIPLDVPPFVFETEGLWFRIPDAARRATEDNLLHFAGGIHALEHACIGLMPVTVMADRNDFGGISTPMHPELGSPAVFIYDGLPGGAGLSRAAFPHLEALFTAVRELLLACPCENGCPSCVHSPKCGSGNRPIDKRAALFLLEQIIAALPGRAITGVPQTTPAAGVNPDSCFTTAARNEPATSTTSGGKVLRRIAPPIRGRIMVLDVETRRSAAEVGGWHRAGQMGVSVAVLHDSEAEAQGGDGFAAYEQHRLSELFTLLRKADLVVGFNILRFDYAVLQPFAPYPLHQLPTLDLLQEVKNRLSYRLSLDNLAQATLDAPKSADGLQALTWWKEGNMTDLTAYCRKDVALTRDLFRFAVQQGYLLFRNKAGHKVRVPLPFGEVSPPNAADRAAPFPAEDARHHI